ncbi:IS1 family transposase [Rickettsiales endosymbiont of Trichoplax sp. H2]|uniref:IS1 family transposase n=1 Tax=Rickettsiales endosymbiont of Trichoplax sp. H2 TaxID=2021221 RepID=UPI0012B32A30|nr:IS1 family transposase [Rickettsiales endosymbiont of Trichoplax sp. H2]MSO13949.1 Insertion element IS1 4 protein InsB [Rickettsiales endosymbiont of Trichoplax sp. H2]
MEGEYTRIWTAVDRDRFKTVSFRVGNEDKENYIDMAIELESKYKEINYMCTDGNKTYGFYKIAKHHVIGKSETALVESFNLSLRDMLARLNRRTKRFSKSLEMLRLTLIMFFNKDISYNLYAL